MTIVDLPEHCVLGEHLETGFLDDRGVDQPPKEEVPTLLHRRPQRVRVTEQITRIAKLPESLVRPVDPEAVRRQ